MYRVSKLWVPENPTFPDPSSLSHYEYMTGRRDWTRNPSSIVCHHIFSIVPGDVSQNSQDGVNVGTSEQSTRRPLNLVVVSSIGRTYCLFRQNLGRTERSIPSFFPCNLGTNKKSVDKKRMFYMFHVRRR